MHIGYMRYNLPIYLSPEGCKDGTALEVTGTLRALHAAGHQVTIFTEIYNKHEHFLRDGEDWQQAIRYEPTGYPGDEIDFLFIENGPTNITFNNRHFKIPHIARTHDVVRHFKGVVFYNQTDVALPFVFCPELYGYTFMTKWIQYGTSAELFQDKHWVVLTKSRDYPEYTEFKKWHNARRSSYEHLDIPVEYHDPSILSIDKNMQGFNPDPKHFLCYTGNNRNGRIVKFREYYEDMGVQTSLYGNNWGKVHPSIDFFGGVPMSEIPGILHDSRCQIMIGDLLFEKLKTLTNRFYECISAGMIVLFDEGVSPFDIYPESKDYTVKNKAEAKAKLQQIKGMSSKEIEKIVTQQQGWIKARYDGEIAENIERLYEKHKAIYDSPTFEDKHTLPLKVWDIYASREFNKPKAEQDLYLVRFYNMLNDFVSINYDDEGFLTDPERKVTPPPGGYPQICCKCGSNIIPLKKPVAKIKCNLCSGAEKAINADDDQNREQYLTDGRMRQTETGDLYWDPGQPKNAPPQTGESLMDMFGG